MAFRLRVSPPPLSATKTLSSAGNSPVLSYPHVKSASELSSGSSSDSDPSSSDSDADSCSISDASSGSSDGTPSKNTPGLKFGSVSEDYLYALLEKAKVNMRSKAQTKAKGKEKASFAELDEIQLEKEDEDSYLTEYVYLTSCVLFLKHDL